MTALADREWRLVREEALDGPTNMALDAVAAETAADGGPRTVRVYRWEPSALSLGYRQDPETVDWTFCDREGIVVTRRPTGGGGIYHDRVGDISYSIVAPADELPGDPMDTYELLCEPILNACERLGVPATFAEESRPAIYQPACYLRGLDPAHDVVVRDERGVKKVSGNAQYRRKEAVIQHGSLTFEVKPERHLAVFADPDADPDAVRERVTGIRDHADVDRREAVEAVETALAEWADADEGTWTERERDAARERAAGTFGSEEWNRDRTDPLD